MSSEGTYQVAIWPNGPRSDEHPWGWVIYVAGSQWARLQPTPPCRSEQQVIREARNAATLLAQKPGDYVWREGAPNSDGAFEREGRPLVAPSRIEDLGISRPRE
jgi:hypothetical protein